MSLNCNWLKFRCINYVEMNVKTRHRLSLLIRMLVFVALSGILSLVMSTATSPWVIIMTAIVLSLAVSYLTFRERDTFYFVSFMCNGNQGRCYLRFPERVSLLEIEKRLTSLNSGHQTVVCWYERVSRYEYELNVFAENGSSPS
nr:MAG TPA: Protein of unknown function (DUF4229) [Siphoviridae sp. ctYIp7]